MLPVAEVADVELLQRDELTRAALVLGLVGCADSALPQGTNDTIPPANEVAGLMMCFQRSLPRVCCERNGSSFAEATL
jgi:hypothetical protein